MNPDDLVACLERHRLPEVHNTADWEAPFLHAAKGLLEDFGFSEALIGLFYLAQADLDSPERFPIADWRWQDGVMFLAMKLRRVAIEQGVDSRMSIAEAWEIAEWQANGLDREAAEVAMRLSGTPRPEGYLSDQVQWMKTTSGLTWPQLGRIFGVSASTVHLWACGGSMSSTHISLLGAFILEVATASGATVEEKRASLLNSRGNRPSVVEEFKKRHHIGPHRNAL